MNSPAGKRLVAFLQEMMAAKMYGDITITLKAGTIVYVMRNERFAADAIPINGHSSNGENVATT